MSKRKTPPPDRSGHSRGRAVAPSRTEDALPVVRQGHGKRCPTCRQYKVEDDRTRTERTLSNADHPLVAYFKMHERSPETDDAIGLSDRFLAFLDHSPTLAAQQRAAIDLLVTEFCTAYPLLGMVLAAHLFARRSLRDMAEELGIDDHTVRKQVRRAQDLLQQLAVTHRIAHLAIDSRLAVC